MERHVAINDGVVSSSACSLCQKRSKAPNRGTVVCCCPFIVPLFAFLPIHRRLATLPTFSRPRTTPSPLKLPKSLPPNGGAKLAAARHEVLPEVRRLPPKTKRWECREDRTCTVCVSHGQATGAILRPSDGLVIHIGDFSLSMSYQPPPSRRRPCKSI